MTETSSIYRSERLPGWTLRLIDSIPPPQVAIAGSVVAGALMAMSTLCGLYLLNGLMTFSRDAFILLYACGAAVGFIPGVTLANLATLRKGRGMRFVVGGLIIFLSMHTAAGTIFAVQYRIFYSEWHADFPSVRWFLQLGFTSAAAFYQFTTNSRYAYFPVAPLVFLGFAYWFSKDGSTGRV